MIRIIFIKTGAGQTYPPPKISKENAIYLCRISSQKGQPRWSWSSRARTCWQTSSHPRTSGRGSSVRAKPKSKTAHKQINKNAPFMFALWRIVWWWNTPTVVCQDRLGTNKHALSINQRDLAENWKQPFFPRFSFCFLRVVFLLESRLIHAQRSSSTRGRRWHPLCSKSSELPASLPSEYFHLIATMANSTMRFRLIAVKIDPK